MPLGKDKVTELSVYFNLTMMKIGNAVHAAGKKTVIMKGIGKEL